MLRQVSCSIAAKVKQATGCFGERPGCGPANVQSGLYLHFRKQQRLSRCKALNSAQEHHFPANIQPGSLSISAD